MKNIYTSFVLVLITLGLANAQTDIVSIGAAYSDQSFYRIHDGSVTTNSADVWDIAFDIDGFGLGIYVNEASSSSMSGSAPEVALFVAQGIDYETVDTIDMERIYNEDQFWGAGAFNHVANPEPLDFGWGIYDINTHIINGVRVFFVKLRDKTFRKIFIEKLEGNIYTFKYADLDGANEVVQTIDKTDYPDKNLVYYSIENQSILDLEPTDWDLLFTRYREPLDAGDGNFINYVVTGVLQGPGVQIAQANGINPETVDYMDYEGQYSDTIQTIGHDWKWFDLGTFSWVVPDDLVYFVKTTENELWKIQFIEFGGSSNGDVTLIRTFITTLSATSNITSSISSFSAFPNPASTSINLAFDSEVTSDAVVRIVDARTSETIQMTHRITTGLNVITVPIDLPNGLYHAMIQTEREVTTQPIVVVK